MAALIWTEPALHDLDAIADYIALDDPQAARHLVRRVFQHVEQLVEHPESGSRPPEMRQSRYRQIVEAPCRVFYRFDEAQVFVLYVMRGEMRLRKTRIIKRDRDNRNA
ncbi:MAG: type II toxin-antitoxin system RelE/ParE family toxin [Chthoniobacterales bacterium]|nr:type II toxin-antitoxin system RelE/ParE family toxin [Chthoniobacterales bacterium]